MDLFNSKKLQRADEEIESLKEQLATSDKSVHLTKCCYEALQRTNAKFQKSIDEKVILIESLQAKLGKFNRPRVNGRYVKKAAAEK